jgi:nicotinamide riboside transporter PnuC
MTLTRDSKYAIGLIVVFATAMITFKHELTLLGFVSLIISISTNILLFYLYRTEKKKNNSPQNERTKRKQQ